MAGAERTKRLAVFGKPLLKTRRKNYQRELLRAGR